MFVCVREREVVVVHRVMFCGFFLCFFCVCVHVKLRASARVLAVAVHTHMC